VTSQHLGYLQRKLLLKTDHFRCKKYFYVEPKYADKQAYVDDLSDRLLFRRNHFMEGHFESLRYFQDMQSCIRSEFGFKDTTLYQSDRYYPGLCSEQSVSLCVRQHRVINHPKRSQLFVREQIEYINQSIKLMRQRLKHPKFYLWSNDYNGLDDALFDAHVTKIKHDHAYPKNKRYLRDLFLMSQAKHFVCAPTTYHWWGCWLSTAHDKIVLRPSDGCFSNFKCGNTSYWPDDWQVVG
jgi:hypothetical protein